MISPPKTGMKSTAASEMSNGHGGHVVDRVIAAAHWLADLSQSPPNVVGELRQRFEISAPQACDAIRRADQMRVSRRAVD